jgi:8-oxo-dGTP pyrophosphatase MutT (NUDIX family)
MVKYEFTAGVVIYCRLKVVKLLLLKYPRYWGFVKGLIEAKENEEETALRELDEEAGIKAEIIPGFKEKQEWFFKFKGQLIKKQAIYFLAKTTKEEMKKVKISFEHEDFAWLDYDEAVKKMKIKANIELLKKAYQFIESYEKQRRLV